MSLDLDIFQHAGPCCLFTVKGPKLKQQLPRHF